ncbi:MAG: hypothetical protein K0B15_01620 [Lentimicrobium sp.]|nr:hypothetical protein [Lentimicrobium sp.]
MIVPLIFLACNQEEEISRASVILKTGVVYTASGTEVSPGGKINIGVLASGAGAALTYIRIERIAGQDTIVQLDRGIYAGSEGYDADFSFPKGLADKELWRVLVMNAERDTASAALLVRKGEGVDYGPIKHFGPISVGMQNASSANSYLDLESGVVYNSTTVSGNEANIDLLPYFYFTSGLPSPTLTCPGYTSAVGYYPLMSNWPVKNTTLFDYYTSDNMLVPPALFDAAVNDSLLVTAYNPSKVSGNCKYAYSGRVIPFKTQSGKYGMIKIINADEFEEGAILLEIKIQP